MEIVGQIIIISTREIQLRFRMERGNEVNLRITISNRDFRTNFVLNPAEREFIREVLNSNELL
ncbi:hypothetical protein D3C87_447750 [compost metagenome]